MAVDHATYLRDWKRKHPDKVREYARRDWTKLRAVIIEAYGGQCWCCGEREPKFLSLDHINGGGTAERKSRGPNSFYRSVKRRDFPPEYRLLCFNCNQARGLYGHCPHELSA